jgi:hypothetical protein
MGRDLFFGRALNSKITRVRVIACIGAEAATSEKNGEARPMKDQQSRLDRG